MKKDLIILNLLNITFMFILSMMTPSYLRFNAWNLIIILNIVLIVIQLKVNLKLIVVLKYILLIVYSINLLIKPNGFFIPVIMMYYLFIIMQFILLYVELNLKKLNRSYCHYTNFLLV